MPPTVDLRTWLAPYGANPSNHQLNQLAQYLDILLLWNRRVALTSLNNPREIVETLFGQSLAIAPFLDPPTGRLADIGSGAGFPGLPLKILFPQLHVTLIEPALKKSIFLEEIIRRLALTAITVSRSRLEQLELPPDVLTAGTHNSGMPGRPEFPSNRDCVAYDWITSRALAARPQILQFASRSLAQTGHVALWVTESEVAILQKEPHWLWSSSLPLPLTHRRLILIGTPHIPPPTPPL
jgi:16S rRNA (guanine527-N7)-methyltransferase